MARRAVSQVSDEAADDAVVDLIASCVNDPLRFVREVFPWGQEGTPLHDEAGPDEWQAQVLTKIGELVVDRQVTPGEAIRLAVASGHGVGKTTLVAWVILWFISTRQNPQIVVTANTAGQLTGKTWRELAKWHRLMVHADWFQWTATKFFFKANPETWFASAVPWTKERAESFAGTHEKHVLIVFDEASAVADEIWDVAEGAMTTPGAMWVVFGNPTRNTGRFRECWRRFRHRWAVYQVDSRTAKAANQAQIRAWVEDYGEDSDFVRIRVKGEFPRAASTQFIDEESVMTAWSRWRSALRKKRDAMGERADAGAPVVLSLEDDAPRYAPLIMSVDVARFGDDQTVLGLRKGNLFLVHRKWRGLDLMQTVAHVAEAIGSYQPDAVFVDEVGIGAGVVDRLRQLGFEVEGVNGALKALDDRQFFNRRMEMWAGMREWLRKSGMIEDGDQELMDDLTAPEYGFDAKSRLQLESKDDMKARGLPSPDVADCLSMTFFMPVAARTLEGSGVLRALGEIEREAGVSHMAF